eukprot:TRINITY_DN801_c4_g1_i1.p1 TRINITY_DN801_c4_g1~~TRINITY_DN801_c4_g1_i1.p1  ORF type:complete len:951 (+),score=334.16 TRINITY_DN801_c4_g1_i1:122-2974(+)
MKALALALAAAAAAAGENCTRGYIQNCDEAVEENGICVCARCAAQYELSTDKRLCRQLNVVPCGGVVDVAFDKCVLNASPQEGEDGGAARCACDENYACLASGVCKDLRCRNRLHACLQYVSALENAAGECRCTQCDSDYVLHSGRCYKSLTCGQVAETEPQCPTNAPAHNGVCTCDARHRCAGGVCAARRTHLCNTPKSAQGICRDGTEEVAGVCRCKDGTTCVEGVCTVEYLPCGGNASLPHRRCQAPFVENGDTGVCECADAVHYKCTADGAGCVPKKCGDEVIPHCLLYDSEVPDATGACVCRKCKEGMANNKTVCETSDVTPSPQGADQFRTIGVYADTSGAKAAYGLRLLAAAQVATAQLNANQESRGYRVALEVVDAAEVTKDDALAHFRKHGIVDFIACGTRVCTAEFAGMDLTGLRFWNPVPYGGQLCQEEVFSTGLVPNQGLLPVLKWASLRAPGRAFVVVTDDSAAGALTGEMALSLIRAIGGAVDDTAILFTAAGDKQARAMETLNGKKKDVWVVNALTRATHAEEFLTRLAQMEDAARFTLLNPYLHEDDVHHMGHALFAGHYFLASYFSTLPSADPGFEARFRAALAGLPGAGQFPPSELSEGVYQAVQFIVQGMGGGLRDFTALSNNGRPVVYMHARRHVSKGLAVARVGKDGAMEIVADETSLYVQNVPEPFMRVTSTGPRPASCQHETCSCAPGHECTALFECIPRQRACGERLEHAAERCKFYGLVPDGAGVCRCGAGMACTGGGACVIAAKPLSEEAFYAVLKVLLQHPYRDYLDGGAPNGALYEAMAEVRRTAAAALGLPLDSVQVRRVCSSDTIFSASLYDAECVEHGLLQAYEPAHRAATAAYLQAAPAAGFTAAAKRERSLEYVMLPAAEFSLDISVPAGALLEVAGAYADAFRKQSVFGRGRRQMEVAHAAVWLKTFPEPHYLPTG